MSNSWFSPKRFGYGATPNTWQGWAATLTFIIVIVALRRVATIIFGHDATGHITFFIGAALVTFGFIMLVRNKTDGEWRWRSGNER